MKNLNKIKGSLFGFAVGDAMGAPLEFMSDIEIQEKFGHVNTMLSGGMWNVEKGEGTDDTILMLILGNAIIENREDPYSGFADGLIAWYNSCPKDLGLTTERTIRNYLKCNDWILAAEETYKQTFGNCLSPGSLSRVLPVALFYDDLEEIEDVAYMQSQMTHYSELTCQCCMFYCKLIHAILNDIDRMQLNIMVNDFLTKIRLNKKQHILYPNGNVLDILNCAIKCFFNTDSFEKAIEMAVNLGGDTDTIAALTGGLAGAFYGYDAIPKEWIDQLKFKKNIQIMIDRL